MRVKIGDKIFNPMDEPIIIMLTESDKEEIAESPKEHKRVCFFNPDESIHNTNDIMEWMLKTDVSIELAQDEAAKAEKSE